MGRCGSVEGIFEERIGDLKLKLQEILIPCDFYFFENLTLQHRPEKEVLTEENLCGVHGTDKKPRICNGLDWGKTDNFFITENCLLENEKGVLKLP